MAPDSDVSGQPVDIDLAVAEAGGLGITGIPPSDGGARTDDTPVEPRP